jgi:long-chain acyl-CoA synthetase
MDTAPWLAHYDRGVPSSLGPYPARTLLDDLAEAAAERPGAPALLFKGHTAGWGELARRSDELAAALAELGVAKGDRVALLLPNCPQFLICELGAWKAGAILLPLNPIYTEQELEGALGRAGAETIVVLTPFYGRVKAVQPRTALRRVIATNVKEYLSPLLRLLFTLARERRDGHRVRLQPGDLWLGELLERHAGASPPTGPPRPEDPASILMSGGTTGTPKGVVGLHRHYTITGRQLGTWLQAGTTPWDDVIMAAQPLFHSFANIASRAWPCATTTPSPWCRTRATWTTCWPPSRRPGRPPSAGCRPCSTPCSTTPRWSPARSTSARSRSASRARRRCWPRPSGASRS